MKKILQYIFLLTALLVGFASCVKIEFEEWAGGEELPYPEEGQALVTFTVAAPAGGFADTKATLADAPTIENMRVVVFGSSGFLKESVAIDEFDSATTNGNGTLYTFKAKLSLTDSKNLKVHVIANLGDVKLPWKYDTEVLTKYAYTTNNQDAYWASFVLPNGVTLKKEWDEGTYSMVYVKDADGYYQVTDDVTDAFCGGSGHPGLPLVRNFAKISIQSATPQFVLDKTKTLAVINRPDRGSVAPYNPVDGTFLLNYKNEKYSDAEHPDEGLRYTYPGFSPSGTQFVDTDPDAASVLWGTGTGDGEDIVSSVYMYERPIPAAGEPVSYMIVHGTYYPHTQQYYGDNQPKNWKETERSHPGTYLDLTQGVPCYYKIDFKDNEGSYAIFRNFRYHIRITNVAKPGAETAGAAGSTGGTGDISQDTSVAGLTDISDGYGRIAVSHTGWTFVEGRAEFELKYKFIEDAAQGDATANNALVSEGGPVTITIGAKTGPVNVISTTLDSSISSGDGTEVDAGANGIIKVMGASTAKDAEGFRTIKFTVNAPDSGAMTSQTIHISGKVNEFSTLSRDITYYLMPRQNMIVECIADEVNADYGEDYVESVAGEGINVRITIPKMLPESMFPLQFYLESDQLSITPNTAKYPEDNLPVANGNSICTGKESSKSFHYVRTLNYTEYQELDETLDGMQFTCHFKTNKAESAGKIYVDNQYFNKGDDSFYNYTMYNFRDLGFSSNSTAAYTNVNFTFSLDDADSYPASGRTVQVKLDGLVPQTGAGLTPVDVDEGIYTYTIQGNTKSATLALKTISTAAGFDNTYAVTLNAYEGGTAIYHEASHGNQAQRITIDPKSYTMQPGDKKTLTATIWPASSGTGSIAWTSSNTSVATVDGNGKVTAVAVGTAQITASHSGLSASCTITVAPIALKGISLSDAKVGIGYTKTLVPIFNPSNATNKNIASWTSSDPTVATVTSSGVVRGIKAGTATITATSAEGGYQASCTVTVKAPSSVTINTNNSILSTGSDSYTSGAVTLAFSSIYEVRNNYIRPNRNNNTITITADGNDIVQVIITFTGNTYTHNYSVDSGSATLSGTTWTWTGSTTSLVATSTSRDARISSIRVVYIEQ